MAQYYIPLVGTPQIGNGGGGSDLPDVTSEDNGDVLTVVNGAWDKAAPSGGGGVFVVNATENGRGGFVLDKTAAEISAAASSGVIVVRATLPIGNSTSFASEVFVASGEEYWFVLNAFLDGNIVQYEAEAEDAYPQSDSVT